jgi:hypothetical protein
MEEEAAGQLPEKVLFRIARGDAKGRTFGTPRNPRAPTLEEFNPRMVEVRIGELAETIVGRRHGILPEQAQRISRLTNEELIRFRIEDPISSTQEANGLSLTGGHHRTSEIILGGKVTQAQLYLALLAIPPPFVPAWLGDAIAKGLASTPFREEAASAQAV